MAGVQRLVLAPRQRDRRTLSVQEVERGGRLVVAEPILPAWMTGR
ncbi:hypothetical protein [Kitasatospora sp. NPDC051164]